MKTFCRLALGILLISFGPIIIKYVDLAGNLVVFYRYFFALIILSSLLLQKKEKIQCIHTKRSFPWLIFGSICMVSSMYFWSTALTIGSTSIVMLLSNTTPLWVGLVSMFIFKEKNGKNYWFGLFLTISGATLLILNNNPNINTSTNTSILYGIISSFGYSIYLVSLQRISKDYDGITVIWTTSLIGTLLYLGINLFCGAFLTNLGLDVYILLFILSLTSQVFGWLLINSSTNIIPSTKLSTALLGQPILVSIFAWILFNEILTFRQIIGAFICLFGIFLVNQKSTNSK